MRVSFVIASLAAISIPAFSAPVTRKVMKRALFSTAVKFAGASDAQALAAQIGNLVGGPPEVCKLTSYIFGQLQSGETAGGTTTIGDRAVVGMRKMLGLQSLPGDTSIESTMETLLQGPKALPPNTLRALQDLVSNPDKTLASLKSYKYLVDTQTTLQTLVDVTKRVDGPAKMTSAILDVALPIIAKMESTIDKIGGDFSIQSFNPEDVDALLAQLTDSQTRIGGLKALNISFAGAITEQLTVVQAAFDNLATSVKTAAAIPDSARKIPADAFTTWDNHCTAGPAVTTI